MRDLSPEGLATTVPLAAAGSRAIAGAIDLLVQIALIALTVVAFKGDTVQAAIRAVLIFVIIFFVPIAFDVLDRGRGPGKRLVGLRVVTLRGGPVGFRTSAVRNLLRIIDFLPTAYLIGIVSIFGTTTGQRIGDLAAGTVVSYVPGRQRKRKDKWVAAPSPSAAGPTTSDEVVATMRARNEALFAVDAVRVTAAEVGLGAVVPWPPGDASRRRPSTTGRRHRVTSAAQSDGRPRRRGPTKSSSSSSPTSRRFGADPPDTALRGGPVGTLAGQHCCVTPFVPSSPGVPHDPSAHPRRSVHLRHVDRRLAGPRPVRRPHA